MCVSLQTLVRNGQNIITFFVVLQLLNVQTAAIEQQKEEMKILKEKEAELRVRCSSMEVSIAQNHRP